MIPTEWFRPEIEAAARVAKVDPQIVEAIVSVESSGRADAFRHEPKFWRRYLAHLDQWKHHNPRRVSSSYGLMQIMYIVAVERGFQGEPEELFVPGTNLAWGTEHLAYLLEWAERFEASPEERLTAALASYNGGRGSNQPRANPAKGPLLRSEAYAKKVRARRLSLFPPSTDLSKV
ncbi:hypothetical protein LCGC14_2423710 [marine sediment metagenome]|uniref:Transglycosylase SLT domain-containing protein n=1 Tax=marine sediment metagenome TaxID=412755 RepID=A0A0F9EI26_9ZZZZ